MGHYRIDVLLRHDGKRQVFTKIETTPQTMATTPVPRGTQLLLQAQRWRALLDETGMTQAELADLEGVSRSKVSQTLMLLRLPGEIQEALLAEEEQVAQLSEIRLRQLVVDRGCPSQTTARGSS